MRALFRLKAKQQSDTHCLVILKATLIPTWVVEVHQY